RLDLATVDDLVAEAEEDVLDLTTKLREEMQMAAPESRAGQRDVEGLVERCETLALELGLAGLERLLQPFAGGVQRHPGLAFTNRTQGLLQLALPAEVADTDLIELGRRRRGSDRGLGLALECLDVHGG